MWDRIELSRHVKVGRQPPGEREIDALRKDGVRAVIDLRTHDETMGHAAPPATEAMRVRARGMDYIHVPVSSESVDRTDLDRVGEALKRASKPVLIHDSRGNRAGMIALAHTAIEAGVPGTEMMEMARHLDLVFGDPAQREVFAKYVDQREIRPDPMARRKSGLRGEGRPVPLLGEDTSTLASEIQEDHHREFAQDQEHVATSAPASLGTRPIATEPPRPPTGTAARPSWTPRASRLSSRIKVIPSADRPYHGRTAAWAPPTPAALGMGVAIATAILLAIDRRLLLPLLIIAGVAGARGVARLPLGSMGAKLLADPAIDHDIDELERRVQRLAKRA